MTEKGPDSTSSDYDQIERRREQKRLAGIRFRERHRERVNRESRERKMAKRDAINARCREKYLENREVILKRNAEWAANNREKRAASARRKRELDAENGVVKVMNTDANTIYARKWRKANREHLREYTREYEASRLATDVVFRLKKNARGRVRQALNGGVKQHLTFDLIGCTPAFLKGHIEGQFEDGMTWDNWAKDGWHIDHIRPLSSFDLTDEKQLLEACHYTNLQPLWANENLSKGSSYGN